MKKLNDLVGYKNRKIYQDSDLFCFSLDSILLSNFFKPSFKQQRILDLGTGIGIIPLIISLKTKANIDGVEIQQPLADLALESIKYNKLEKQISIYNEDMKQFAYNKEVNSYDVIISNPPFYTKTSSVSKNKVRENCCVENLMSLDEILQITKKLLNNNGSFYMVFRNERLIEVIEKLRQNNLEPKIIRFVHNSIKDSGKLFLIKATKNGKLGLTVENPLILYDNCGIETKEYSKILTEV